MLLYIRALSRTENSVVRYFARSFRAILALNIFNFCRAHRARRCRDARQSDSDKALLYTNNKLKDQFWQLQKIKFKISTDNKNFEIWTNFFVFSLLTDVFFIFVILKNNFAFSKFMKCRLPISESVHQAWGLKKKSSKTSTLVSNFRHGFSKDCWKEDTF